MPNEDSAKYSKKEQRRKDREKRRKAENSEMRKENKNLKKIIHQMARDAELGREAAEQDRKMVDRRFDEQSAVMRQYAEQLHHSNLLLKTTVESTVLPVIATIMYKVMYRVGFGKQRVEPRPGKDHRSILLSNLDRFARFGFHSNEEMESFANSWPHVIDDRNNTAHTVCGDDVLRVLTFANPDVRHNLERGLKLIFGLDTVDWSRASDEQKMFKIST